MSAIENQNHTDSASTGASLIVIGFDYGVKAGFWLSIIYALTGMVVVTFAAEGFKAFPMLVGLLAFGFVGIFFMAIAPATLYGLFTGIILGAFIEKFKKRIPRYIYSVSSMLICLSIAVITHLIFGIRPALSFNSMASSGDSFGVAPFDSYLFSIGFPTIIYIITGGWTGWKLYSKMFEKNG